MICRCCGLKLIKTHQVESEESIEQYLDCPEHGNMIIVSTSKRKYGRNGTSWLESISSDELDKALNLEDK